MDATKDYVYSTWDDNRMRSWLQEHGIETKPHHSRTDLMGRMNEVWHNKINDPIYNSWSDNYLKSWLVAHGIVHPPHERDRLVDLMKKNYWDAKDTVYSAWSTDAMRNWLISEGVLSSDAADLSREKYSALLTDNYHKAKSTIFSGWYDSELRDWLIQHGIIKSDYEANRDEMVKMISDKYHQKTDAPYLAWPDARLRAYLRDHGVDDTKYTDRPSLVHETRIRYVQATSRVESLLAKIREAIGGSVDYAEEKLSGVLEMLTGSSKLSAEEQLSRGYASASSAGASAISAAS